MMKRILAVVLAMMMMSVAFAAAETLPVANNEIVPSKSALDNTQIVNVVALSGVEVADDFAMIMVENTEAMEQELEALRAMVANGESLLNLLPEESKAKALELLGEGADLNNMVVYEYVAVNVANYEEAYGDMQISFSFATPYVEGMKAVAFLGFALKDAPEGAVDFEWNVLPAEIDADGKVNVTFTQEQLLRLEQEPGMMMILSDPMPEIAE